MRIRLLATGGTIASRVDETGAVVPAIEASELVAAVPELGELGSVEVEHISQINGWNMTLQIMEEVARRAQAALSDDGVDGVVVTHGTDTVEETIYLTDLLAGDATSTGGIAFACAMRAASELGADGSRNLLDAALVATDPSARGRGALLCVNDEIHAARWVTKTDTTNISTFRSPPAGPVGSVENGEPVFWLDTPARPPCHGGLDPHVALIKAYSGMDDAILRWMVDNGAHGLVVEGSGAGNVPGDLVPGIIYALEREVSVLVTSRCWTGRTAAIYGGPGGGMSLDELGVLRSNDLSSPKARLALMAALASGYQGSELKEWFAHA